MKLPKRGEKGFTLVELLIVLAILAVLAAVVIPNITGLFGRGAEQAYDTDDETIQLAVATFYFDIHDGYRASTNEWQETAGEEGHWYPTRFGDDTYDDGTNSLALHDTFYDPDYPNNRVVVHADTPATLATEQNIEDTAIWMGLLINADGVAGTGVDGGGATPDPVERANVEVLDGEKGPYLNEIPESAGADNGGSGTYTWIMAIDGRIYGVYLSPTYHNGTAVVTADCYIAGFNGDYP
jgi:prepilin-type N-terminal cleavage/methylation domain-containing protein